MRETVTIKAGYDLDGWVYTPENAAGPAPAIVMAHGLAAVKDQFLDIWARAFCDAGFVVVVYDHRGFGKSGGPRLDVDPWAQIRDAQDVISYTQALESVDETRIGFWGTSFSGGHGIVLGAIDRRIKSVVVQVPTVDGINSFRRRTAPPAVEGREAAFANERRRLFAGEEPTMLHLLPHDGKPGIWHDPKAEKFFEQPDAVPESFEGKMTLLSAERARDYNPIEFISRISPTPLLMIVGDDDTVVMTDLNLEAYERALHPKKLELFKGAHWTPYLDEMRDYAIAKAVDWFGETLLLPSDKASAQKVA